MKNKLNYDDVAKKLELDGVMQEPDANWILEYIQENNGSSLDTKSSWAKGHEGLLVYTESTADSYDLFVCTSDHKQPMFDSEVYYYEDYQSWAEQIIDTLEMGSDVWVADHVWCDMEYDFNYELEQWWSDIYDDLHAEKVDELIDEGYGYEE